MTDRISQRVSSLFLLILTVFISNMADSPAIGAGIEGSDIGAFSSSVCVIEVNSCV